MINFDFHKYVNKYVKKEDKITYLDRAKEIKPALVCSLGVTRSLAEVIRFKIHI